MNFQTMSKQRKAILIAAAVGFISMFLPWWSLSLGIFGGGSVNGMHNEGIVVFLCFVGAAAISLMGDQTKNLTQNNWMSVLIAGAIAVLITLITFFNAPPIGDRGFGLYIALIAAIALVAFTYVNRTAGETLQSGFDGLKGEINRKVNTNTTTTATNTTNIAGTTTVSNPTAEDPARPTA